MPPHFLLFGNAVAVLSGKAAVTSGASFSLSLTMTALLDHDDENFVSRECETADKIQIGSAAADLQEF
jgi:hypothetical protein